MSGAVSVEICVPTGDEVKAFWAYDLAQLMAHTTSLRPDIKVRLTMCSGSLVMKQREILVDSALETDATHVLFLDTDMRFPKDALLRLLAHEVPLVCVNYTSRQAPFVPVAFQEVGNWNKRSWPTPEKTGLEPVGACGFGVMLVTTDALRRIKKPRFMVDFDEESNGWIGEDVYFCDQLGRAGIAVLVDNDLTKEVVHIGQFGFSPEHGVQFGVAHGFLPGHGKAG